LRTFFLGGDIGPDGKGQIFNRHMGNTPRLTSDVKVQFFK
jgi:hypothetical protein